MIHTGPIKPRRDPTISDPTGSPPSARGSVAPRPALQIWAEEKTTGHNENLVVDNRGRDREIKTCALRRSTLNWKIVSPFEITSRFKRQPCALFKRPSTVRPMRGRNTPEVHRQSRSERRAASNEAYRRSAGGSFSFRAKGRPAGPPVGC